MEFLIQLITLLFFIYVIKGVIVHKNKVPVRIRTEQLLRELRNGKRK